MQLKRVENPVLIGLLRASIAFYLRRAERVVAIGGRMRERLIAKGASPARTSVIPNWVDTEQLLPQPHENAWADEHDLAGKFVVMHSGNVGHAQNLDALVRSATFLRDLENLRIVIVGGGARRRELVELARVLEVLGEPVTFLNYQPRARLSESLSAAHVHVVGLAPGLSGYVVPSRLYGILAVGRPVIVAADDESETAEVVREVGAGVVVRPGRPELLAAAIRAPTTGTSSSTPWASGDASTLPPRPTVASPSSATAGSCGSSSRDDREGRLLGSLGALAWTHVGYPAAAALAARLRTRPVRQGGRLRASRSSSPPMTRRT